MSENQEPNGETTPQQTNGSSGGNPVNNVVQKGKKTKQMAQNIKKMAQTVKKLSMSGPLMTVLFWVFVAIVALIIITGLIMFIVTMPGMIMDKLKALFKEIGNYVASFFGADTTQQIDDVRIFETLDYIEDMGWDLKSEGFLTGYYDNDDKTEIEKELDSSQKEAGYNIDEKQGVVRSSEGNIILAQSDFIFTYIMSDNYVYTLKNDNLATQNDPDANWFKKLVTGAATAWYKIRNFTLGPIYDAIGLTEATMDKWGKGLIAIYYDNGLGVKGDPVNGGTLFNWDSVKIDTESKKLSIVKNELFNLNNPIEYSLDGWTGRYGMPLEFLLAVHKATMMPDLAFDMATTFNTNVNLYLHDISDGEAMAAYKTPNGQYITFDKVNKAKTGVEGRNIFSAIVAWFDNLIESDTETMAMAELGVDVCTGNKEKDNCSCTVEKVYYYFNEDDDPVAKGDYILRFDESTGKYYFQSRITEESENGTKTEKIEEVEFDTSKDNVSDIVVKTTATDVCDRCEKVSKQITNILAENKDYNFDYYMPYIANVSNHWYRDVYFVLSDDTKADYKGEEELAFVDYDYDYESVMKERWTLYETYTDNKNDGYKYNPDKVGEFIVFVIDENGKYEKDENDNYVLFDGSFEEARGEVLFVKNDKDEYTMYTGVVNDNGKAVDKDGKELAIQLYRKTGKDEYTLYNKGDTVAVAKKAVTFDATDTEKLEDVGWNNDSGLWTAYEEDPNVVSSGWERLFTDDAVAEISDEYEKYVKQNAYINITSKNNIVQVGEGQRAETNPEIKKMFLQNKYFRYDGSTETADIITALREQDPDNDKDDIVYGALDKEELKKTVTIDGKTYKASDYAGTVVLNQDSLNAFSMLENTHTLDADYIYRDFKELVVELGYFEKEELTDETAKLLEFPIPEIGSSGFPDRTIDKREVEEGTMIHSTHDIVANKKYTLKELVNQMGEEISEEGDPNAQAVSGIGSTNLEDNISSISSQTEEQPKMSSRVNNDRLSLSVNSINTSEVGAISARKSPSQITVEEFIKSTREMCEFINKVGYDYCVINLVDSCSVCSDGCTAAKRCLKYKDDCSCKTNHCKHNIHENGCGLQTTFEASKAVGKNNFCCATLVSWALQNVGVMPDEDHIDGAETLAEYCLNELKGEKIERSEELEPGDILCYEGHIDICGEKNGSGFIKYNGGHQVRIGATQGGQDSCIEEISGWPDNALYAVRLNWGKHEEAPYEGYVGNEAVVSPVSGILLEYGVYEVSKDSNEDTTQDMATTTEESTGERINIDLKYGPSLNLGNTSKEDEEETETTGGDGTNTGDKTTEEEDNGVEKREWSDTVGYARILVLNKEIFEMLDSSVSHRWRNDNDGNGLLSKNGQFYDMVTTEKELEKLTDESTGDFLSETVYGYKEFTEMYEKYGIAGYYVYIDGFKCELPDPDFIDSDEDGELSDEEGNPDGEDLTYDSFKIKTTQIENENKLIESLYEAPIAYKVASKKATEKLNTEEAIKTDTYPAMVIDNPKSYEPLNNLDELIFIKEGTVLGRTYTDKELIEERLKNGDDQKYDYEYYAPEEDTVVNEKGEEEENLDKLIGNYVMVRMSDPNKTVENVENYMKLDEVTQSEPNDWELFFWLPFESGGTDEDGCGPESQGSCSSGETAVGIIQWTVLTSKNMNNISSQFITGCLEENPTLCAPLSAYKNWSAQDFWNDYSGGSKQFQKTLSEICDADRDNFLSVQMQVAKKQYLDPLLETYPWLEDRPSCVQGAVMHLKVWGASTSWLPGYATSTDEEIILKVRNTIANTSSTAGEASGDENSGRAYNEPQIALEILTGAVSTEDVEQWVRTRDTSVFDFKFK